MFIEDVMFYVNLLIYIILNLIATYKMYKCQDRDTKVGLGCLPLPLLILVIFVNHSFVKYIIGFDNFDGYDAYGMCLIIVGGNIMVISYIVNIIVYRYSKIKNNNKNKK